MNHPHFPFSNLIGKEVVERYGRFKGRIIGLDFNPHGEVTGIVYENGGVILSKNSDSFKVRDGYVEIGPPSILRAEELIGKLDMLKLQFEAAYNIKVSQDSYSYIYESVIKELDTAYEELKIKIEDLIKGLETRKSSLENKKKWLFRLFFNMSVAKKIGGLDDKHYLEAYETLETELFRIDREIEDVTIFITELSHKLKDIELYMTEKEFRQEPEASPIEQEQENIIQENRNDDFIPSLNFESINVDIENKVGVEEGKSSVEEEIGDKGVYQDFWG